MMQAAFSRPRRRSSAYVNVGPLVSVCAVLAIAGIVLSLVLHPIRPLTALDFAFAVGVIVFEMAAVRLPYAGIRFSVSLPLVAALALRVHPVVALSAEAGAVALAGWRFSQSLGSRVDGPRLFLNILGAVSVVSISGATSLFFSSDLVSSVTFCVLAMGLNALGARVIRARLESHARSPLDLLGWPTAVLGTLTYGFFSVGAAWFWTAGDVWQGAVMLGPIVLLAYAVHAHGRKQAQHQETMAALTLMLQRVHPYTHGHLERVARMAEEVGRRLGLGPRRSRMVRDAAILHDIGKIAIDEDVLDKPGRLTEEEFAHVKKHAEFGGQILEACPSFVEISRWIHAHHERPDGTGYPEGKRLDAIPVESRIIAVVDAFDAMVGGVSSSEKRGYREPMDIESALTELERCSGTQFDTAVVRVFREVIEDEVRS